MLHGVELFSQSLGMPKALVLRAETVGMAGLTVSATFRVFPLTVRAYKSRSCLAVKRPTVGS
jgi:hypothetical protein